MASHRAVRLAPDVPADVAPLIAEARRRISNESSVSSLFNSVARAARSHGLRATNTSASPMMPWRGSRSRMVIVVKPIV